MKKNPFAKRTNVFEKNLLQRVFISLICFMYFFSVSLGSFSQTLGREISSFAEESENLQSDGIVRPEDISEGLSRKSFEDIEGRRVTLRQPYMEVTDTDVRRTKADLLSDEFQFIDPQTGEPYVGLGQENAKINFAEFGTLNSDTDPMYPKRGLENNSEGKYFNAFQKYMLLRQAWFYRTKQAARDIENNSLKKHPAADGIYGQIADSAKAVKKTIISDPIYKTPLTTGLYLVPGEVAVVTVSGLNEGQTVELTTHQQDSLGYDGSIPKDFVPDESYNGLISTEKYFRYWDSILIKEAQEAFEQKRTPNYTQYDFGLNSQWQFQNQKVPCMGSSFVLKGNGTFKIGSIYGGPLFLQPTSSNVTLTIEGAVETPHYILGVTTKDEFEASLRNAPGLIATLDVENGLLVGLSEHMRKCDDIEKIAYFWHSVFAINESLNGRAYNYNITMAYDLHVPAGEAVALSGSFAAQPQQWFGVCMNYKTLTTQGNWGTFHELGHIQAKTYGVNWGMCSSNCPNPCEGEVWNNTLIILAYAMLCNMDPRVTYVEHGEFVHPFTVVKRSMSVQKVDDYHNFSGTPGEHFDQLSLYATLIHSFGPERFVDFFYTYKVNPSYCTNARADFIYRIGLVDHVNIFDWINTNYYGNVTENDFSSEQLEYLKSLPVFYPIAYEWANGINGNETARKYDVDGKYQTIFNLSKQSFASPKDFEIVEVSQPKYGTIKYEQEKQRAIYTPPAIVVESDSFDIVVSTFGGRIVSLNVRMNLVYNGAHVEVFKLSEDYGKNVDQVIETFKDAEPDRTEESLVAGKAEFNSDELEYYRIKFKFKALEAGFYKFTACGDDGKEVFFSKNGEYIKNGAGQIKYSGVNSYVAFDAPDNNFASTYLDKGEEVDIVCHLMNWGGRGLARVGVVFPGANQVVDIPAENMTNALVSKQEEEQAKQFKGWQPKFLDSIKDQSMAYEEDKTDWQVIECPDYQVYAEYNGLGAKALVDGNMSTIFHSRHSGGPIPSLPHVFVIDCKKNLLANYFSIHRRTTDNDMLFEIALYGAKDNGKNQAPSSEEYVCLFDGELENPKLTTYKIQFEKDLFRYFKLVVKKNKSHTVIREVSAGFETDLNQTVKPSSFEKRNDGFKENKANGKLSTEKQSAVYEFEFLGSGFDVFADTAPEYGSADVFVDNNLVGQIDLSDKLIFNKCVFTLSNLSVKSHSVKIVTTSNKQFNISFVNVTYAVPVEAEDYPTLGKDYGDKSPLLFDDQWKTLIANHKNLSRIDFLKAEPKGYEDTLVRLNTFIRVYQKKDDQNQIAFVYPGTIVAPSDCSFLFAGCEKLEAINFENFDTSSMTLALSMFYGCQSLTELDLSGFDTQKTLCFSKAFENCTSLHKLNISSFVVSKQAQTTDLLKGCENLFEIDVPQVFENKLGLAKNFVDYQTKMFSTEISSKNAGHTMFLHEDHTYTHFDLVPATRDEGGIKEHDECVCGRIVIDGKGVSRESLAIEPKGYGDIIAGVTVPCAVLAIGGITFVAIRSKNKKSKKKSK